MKEMAKFDRRFSVRFWNWSVIMINFTELPEGCSDILADPIKYISEITPDILNSVLSQPQNLEYQNQAIKIAFCTLTVFITNNFTGPPNVSEINESVLKIINSSLPEKWNDDLNLNGEEISPLVVLPEFMWLSYTLFRRYESPQVWVGRAAFILQQCLSGPSEELYTTCVEKLTGLELALAYRYYHKFSKFFEVLEEHKQKLQLEYTLTGKLGKKTKFQLESKAQFVLEIQNCASIRNETTETHEIQSEMNAREIKLDEDISRLERPELDNEIKIPPLTDEELCYFLVEAIAMGERNPGREIRDETRIPILEAILQAKAHYSITTMALFVKSTIEKKETNTQQRAAIQLESIIDDFPKPVPAAFDRLKCVFLIGHLPLWEIRREMGLQLLMIGSAKSAANIFVEHKMWDELAMCCQVSKDPSMAIDVLANEKPTPLVLCILGELKKDKELLVRAWNDSNHRLSRAQRSLGKFEIREEHWEEAIAAFELALALNKLYPDIWFSYGCAKMRLENFEEAIVAFQHVVSIKSEDSECLSNLALCLMTVGKNSEAHQAITQAIRYDRNSTKLWENYILISMNAEIFNDCLHGLEELVKCKPKWCNTPMLYDLMQTFVEHKVEIGRFLNCLNLISENADCGFDFWTIYADISEASTHYEAALDMRQNVIKALEKDGKVHDAVEFERIVVAAENLVKTAKKIPSKMKGAGQRVRVLIKKYKDDFEGNPLYDRLAALAEEFN